ncbi:hypothetical protein HGRIS_012058 [Hohenbuehelia grisea]|uniref:Uncharacterized protein n=1 Tax=Hohenbuehelia grisea TaxID=104357 RepID=A0ABR3IR43_9AGAR
MPHSGLQSPVTPIKATSPTRPTLSPTNSKNNVTTPLVTTKPLAGTTAQDLLNSIGLSALPTTTNTTNGSTNDLYRAALPQVSTSTAPQPQLLFGSAPPNRVGHSIWSTALDDPGSALSPHSGHHAFAHTSPTLAQAHSHSHSLPYPQTFSPPSLTQSAWAGASPPSMPVSQNSQLTHLGQPTLSPTIFPPAAVPVGLSSHQRVPSASFASSQVYSPVGNLANLQQQTSLLGHSMNYPTVAAGLAYGQHVGLHAEDLYGPFGGGGLETSGALYETPQQPAGHMRSPSQSQLGGYHSRHLSLANDPRMAQAFGVPGRPLQSTWGSTG